MPTFGDLRESVFGKKKKKKKRKAEDVGKDLDKNKALQAYNLGAAKRQTAAAKKAAREGTLEVPVSKAPGITKREELSGKAAKAIGRTTRKVYEKTLKTSVDQVLSDVEGIKKYGKSAWEKMKKRKSI
jgi:hypothetical protein